MDGVRGGPTVSNAMIKIFLRFISGKGLDVDEIMGAAGIAPSLIENPQGRISGRRFESIWNEALIRTKDPDFGLHLGEEVVTSYTSGHILFNVMKNCPTVGDAMEKFSEYHCIMADTARPTMEQVGNFVHISWDESIHGYKASRHSAEAMLCMYTYILRHLTEDSLNLTQVRFTHPEPDNVTEHKRIFRSPLSFDQRRSELVVDVKDFSLPIFLANPEFLESLEEIAQGFLKRLYSHHTVSERVARSIGRMLLGGQKVSLEAIGDDLVLSPRTLQNKLREEGSRYQDLFDDVRKEIAKNYLKDPNTNICDIVFVLGFSEQSAFNHAFKRWTGVTPTEYVKIKQDQHQYFQEQRG